MALEKSSMPPVPESNQREKTEEYPVVPPPEAIPPREGNEFVNCQVTDDWPYKLMLDTLKEMKIRPADLSSAERALDKGREMAVEEKRKSIVAMLGVVGKRAYPSQV